MKIIINADDCGYSPEVNKAIDYALSVGAISSTTILANTKYISEVKDLVDRYPNASFGIHLNLTEGHSLTKQEIFKERGIVDDCYCFVHGNSQRCVDPDEELSNAIYDEWDAQFSLLKGEGLDLSHVDGHHHCHTWPGLEHVLVRLMKKHGIRKVRNRYNYPNMSASDFIRRMALKGVMPLGKYSSFIMKRTQHIVFYKNYNLAIKESGIITTDYFGSYDNMLSLLKGKRTPDGTLELMCHPGLKDYADEYQHLLSDVLGINRSNMQLISYKELIL